MESQLHERIYSGTTPASISLPRLRECERLPLGYEVAFGAYARRMCSILAPADFALTLTFHEGMDFQVFVESNHIELLDDDDQLPIVTTYPDPTAAAISIDINWEVSGIKALEGLKE